MSPLTAQPPAKDVVPAQVEDAEETRRQHRSAIKAAFIGTFIEWFDYAAYIYMSAIISRVFFPEMEGRRALIMTFALFALSFLVRPLGGIVWGHFGDKYGRIHTLTVSIVMMSVATACIGFLPGYATIGFAASILLLLCRMVQGFSAAGEYAGAATHLAEIAPAGKRGIYSAVVPSATASGLLLGSLIAALLTGVLDDAALDSWGWRVPFLIALPLGLYGLWIRRNTEESSHFEDQDEPEESPLREVLKYPKALAIAFAGAVLNAIGFYVILTYLPTYLSEELGMAATPAFIAPHSMWALPCSPACFRTVLVAARRCCARPPSWARPSFRPSCFSMAPGSSLSLSFRSAWAACWRLTTASCPPSFPNNSPPTCACPASR